MSQLYAVMGKYADAISEYQKALPTSGSWNADAKGFGSLFSSGMLNQRSKTGYEPESFIAIGFAIAGDRQQTFDWLNKAVQNEDDQIGAVIRYPMFDGLRSDPRYADIMHRLGLPQ
jgi:hypothetical protein